MSDEPDDPDDGGPFDERIADPECERQCGYTLGDGMIRREPKYSFGAWFVLLFGISIEPSKMLFRCRKCHRVVHESTDPAILKVET